MKKKYQLKIMKMKMKMKIIIMSVLKELINQVLEKDVVHMDF